MLEFLINLGINADLPDYDEVTPFNLLSTLNLNSNEPEHNTTLHQFFKLDVRIDFPNRKGRTPFLNFYEKQNFDLAYKMIDMGANVN